MRKYFTPVFVGACLFFLSVFSWVAFQRSRHARLIAPIRVQGPADKVWIEDYPEVKR